LLQRRVGCEPADPAIPSREEYKSDPARRADPTVL
jgi:hypothetical protein